ncbi:hypothetical protein KR074_010993 [Drosophila pseudoananassae]|nr:hypothetical protein KR074_010993 [Drosophila pseudoananassae]
MFKVVHLHALILVSCFCCPEAQHPAWLYPMPWRPLILPRPVPTPVAGVSQLSPGYTGPQTFPPVPQDQQQGQQQQPQYSEQYQQQYPQQQQYPPQQPVLFGLFAPQLQVHPLAAPPQAGHFTLPFRPSPFAGYTDEDEVDNEVQERPEQQPHQQQLEPPYHAHPYKVAERLELSPRGVQPQGSGSGSGSGSTPLGYVYLSPSNIYNLVRS